VKQTQALRGRNLPRDNPAQKALKTLSPETTSGLPSTPLQSFWPCLKKSNLTNAIDSNNLNRLSIARSTTLRFTGNQYRISKRDEFNGTG
jgi:hypothetical protein